MRVDDLGRLELEPSPGARPGVILAIGAFDGVHRGHRHLLSQVVSRAVAVGCESMVATFDRLPAAVLRPEAAPPELTDLEERLSLLAQINIDRVGILRFNSEVASLSPDEFLQRIERRYDISEIWEGVDFAFGHKRQGTISFLAEAAERFGFGVHIVPPLRVEGEKIGSRRIRELVAGGMVAEASTLLGHYPTVSGIVEPGAGRGRPLGYPTANLSLSPGHIVPASGIYAGWATVAGHRLPAAISIGHNPTFGMNPLSVEAFILGFDADVVGQRVMLELVGRIRDEERFSSASELIAQMADDVTQVRRLLNVQVAAPSAPCRSPMGV